MFRPRRLRLSALLRGLRGGRGCAPLPSRTERESRPAWVSASGRRILGRPLLPRKNFPFLPILPPPPPPCSIEVSPLRGVEKPARTQRRRFLWKRRGGGRRRAYRSESDVPMISRRDVVDSGEFFLIHPMPRAVQRRGFKRLVSVRIPR